MLRTIILKDYIALKLFVVVKSGKLTCITHIQYNKTHADFSRRVFD